MCRMCHFKTAYKGKNYTCFTTAAIFVTAVCCRYCLISQLLKMPFVHFRRSYPPRQLCPPSHREGQGVPDLRIHDRVRDVPPTEVFSRFFYLWRFYHVSRSLLNLNSHLSQSHHLDIATAFARPSKTFKCFR